MKQPCQLLSRCLLGDGHGFRELRRDADGKFWDVSPDDLTAQKDWGNEQGWEKAQRVEELDLSGAMWLYNAMREIFLPPMAAFPPLDEWSPELLRRQLSAVTTAGLAAPCDLTDERLIEEIKIRGLQALDCASNDQLMDEIQSRGMCLEKTLSEAEDLELVEELQRREPTAATIDAVDLWIGREDGNGREETGGQDQGRDHGRAVLDGSEQCPHSDDEGDEFNF